MKKTKVIFIHNVVAPHLVSFLEKINAEKKLEMQVLFASEKESNRIWRKEKGMKFNYKIMSKITFELKRKDLFSYPVNPTIFFELLKTNPDIIVVGGWHIFAYQVAFLYAKLFRKKFIVWSGSTKGEKGKGRKLAKYPVKLMLTGSDAYIAYGTRAQEYLISMGAKGEKIFIAYNSIDNKSFEKELKKWQLQKEKIKKEMGIKTDEVILYVGQLIERKGVELLVRAFGEIKKKKRELSLLVVGYGPLEKRLKSLVKRKKIPDVFFTGGVAWQETPKFYAVSDIFVLPSLEEVWGLVVNEAMVSGLPVVITSSAGSSKDLISDGNNGYVVRPGSLRQLSLTLEKLSGNNLLKVKMAKKSLTVIDDYSQDKSVKGILEAIEYVTT